MNKYTLLIPLLLIVHLTYCSNSLENWSTMQHYYRAVLECPSLKTCLTLENDLCHPHWQKIRTNTQRIVQGTYNPNFLGTNDIIGTMVRSGMTIGQTYELCFLTDCTSEKTKNMIGKFQDTHFGNLPRECSALNCSSNTLGHLFYAARTVDLMEKEPEIIIEFGAGYGNLARIYQNFFPQCTYIMIDLPEFLALQYFFLKETVPDKNIIFHTDIPQSYDKNAIHLIPVNFLDHIDLVGDLFISTFGLSEASAITQRIVQNKKFFNAKMAYIIGQLNDTTGQLNGGFAHHSIIHNGLRSHYKDVDCHPFHFILNNLKTYEIIARSPIS